MQNILDTMKTIAYTNPPWLKNCCSGLVLHRDSDISCLKQCISLYKYLNVNVIGVVIKEEKQPQYILYLLSKYNPNILVVTGHDCSKTTNPYSRNINDYKYSKYFIQSVLLARRYNPDTNKLVIIAGGCESYYESLIKAGANFASSPERISITITAPVYIAYRLFNTPRNMVVTMDSLYNDFHFDYGSFGGINTYGQCYK